MTATAITLGNNFEPPVVNIEVAQNIYERVKTDDFEVDVFNGLLMAVTTYLNVHGVDYGDKALPWAEEMPDT